MEIANTEDWVRDFLRKERYKYKTITAKYYEYKSIPKAYRKVANRKRRTQERKEIWKAINFIEYEEQCSKWNCKDNDHWSYW